MKRKKRKCGTVQETYEEVGHAGLNLRTISEWELCIVFCHGSSRNHLTGSENYPKQLMIFVQKNYGRGERRAYIHYICLPVCFIGDIKEIEPMLEFPGSEYVTHIESKGMSSLDQNLV